MAAVLHGSGLVVETRGDDRLLVLDDVGAEPPTAPADCTRRAVNAHCPGS
ncbi:hypothetical protein AB0D54_26105 [Streptomyces xanthophaeus]